jgi:hypothetical protein
MCWGDCLFLVKTLVLGEKLWEGKGKSGGQSFIKSVDMSGVASMYNWSAQVKGVGKAKGVDGTINVTSFSMSPPKGVATTKRPRHVHGND